jgi:(p)ppGpp synthase/HD superfamily hydrolase
MTEQAGIVERSAELARWVHRGQKRKGKDGVNYFDGHLEPVSRLVSESGGSDVQVAAAYLHDAVEDGGGPDMRDRIQAEIGADVAAIVVHLSDSVVDTTGGAKKEEWAARKRRYIGGLADAPIEVLEVSVADKLHNAESMLDDYDRDGPAAWAVFSETRPERQLWYYTSLLAIFDERIADHPLTRRLTRVLTTLLDRVRSDEPDIDRRLAATQRALA